MKNKTLITLKQNKITFSNNSHQIEQTIADILPQKTIYSLYDKALFTTDKLGHCNVNHTLKAGKF